MSEDTTLPDALLHQHEHTGAGVRALHRRLKHATTGAELAQLAADAVCRSGQPGLPSTVEIAYKVIRFLAHQRLEEAKDIHGRAAT
jgi:hypothetical protein